MCIRDRPNAVAIGAYSGTYEYNWITIHTSATPGDGSNYMLQLVDASQLIPGMLITNGGYTDATILSIDYGTNTLTLDIQPNNGSVQPNAYLNAYGRQGTNALAIGAYAAHRTQHANSIVINATGSELKSAGSGTTVIQTLRQVTGGSIPTGFYQVAWNPTTGELIVVTP